MSAPESHERVGAVVRADVVTGSLDGAALEREVWSAEHGAVVLFHGIVRDHDGGRSVLTLDYEAHPDAAQFLAACCAQVAASRPVTVGAVHRVGALAVGDVALVAAVASAHRAEAFAACAELVDLIKVRVPIWKRQSFVDGDSAWVGL